MRLSIKPAPEEQKIYHLAKALGVSSTIAYLLVQRGIETFEEAKDFFRPNLKKLPSPFLMRDMKLAVNRIQQAVQNKERILVYGDYDVDGTTAVTLLATYLKQAYGLEVETYIPDRYTEGYGISIKGIDYAAQHNFSLIIALDCGIKAIDQVDYAQAREIDFIICDHHTPGEELPKAIAVLNPKRLDCGYPFKELCGCGVGFKLIQALQEHRGGAFEELIPYLDLVATAIAADIVPITGENRILAAVGLKVINQNPRTGLKAIISQINKKELSITDVVFIIAPRINAAGRMQHALYAVDLLMETDYPTALEKAKQIEIFNTDRKTTDQEITREARLQIEENEEQNRCTTVVCDKDWHKGVIGIVASRLMETYYRPTIVFTQSGNKWTGSARSVKGFDIYRALEACREHIEQFGGHKYAAGLTLKPNHYESFKQKFEAVVSAGIDRKLLIPHIQIDKEIELKEIDAKFYRILKQFAPFGPGNMRPVFLSRQVLDTGYAQALGKENEHLRAAFLQRDDAQYFTAIGFGLADRLELVKDKKPLDIVYVIDENEWNNKKTIQLKLREIL